MPMSPSSFVPSERLTPGNGAFAQAPQVAPEHNYAPQQIENLGQAVSQAGGEAFRTGQSMTRIINDTIDDANVKNAETQLLVNGTGVARDYMQLAGNDAIRGYKPATEALAKAKDDAAAGLTNPLQKATFDRLAQAHLATIGGQMYDHNHQQTVSFGITAAKTRSQMAGLQALQAADSRYQTDANGLPDGDFHAATRTMEEEAKAAARLSGYHDDDPQSKAMVNEVWAGLNNAILGKLFDNHDLAGAEMWFNEQVKEGHFDVNDAARFETNIKKEKEHIYVDTQARDGLAAEAAGTKNAPVTFAPIAAGAPINPTTPVTSDGMRITDQPGSARPGGHIHNGYDIAMPVNTPLLAPAAGTVTRVWDDKEHGGGLSVEVTLDDKRVVGMAHLSAWSVKEGQQVAQGDALGRSGKTGDATGPSVHYMLRNADGSIGDPFKDSQPQPNPSTIGDPQVLQNALKRVDASSDPIDVKEQIKARMIKASTEQRTLDDRIYEEDVKTPAIQALYKSGGNWNAIPGDLKAKLKEPDATNMRNFEMPVKDDMPTVAGFITQPQTVTVQSVNDAFSQGKLSRGSYTEFLQRAVNFAKAPNEQLEASANANNIKVIANDNGITKDSEGADYDERISYLTYQVEHQILAQEQATGRKLDQFAKDKITRDMLVKMKTTDLSPRGWYNPARWVGSPFSISETPDTPRFRTLDTEGAAKIPADMRAWIINEAHQQKVDNPTEDFIQKRYAQLKGGQ